MRLKIENKLPKLLTITVDLTGSRGVRILESSNTQRTVNVPPKESRLLVTLFLSPVWKLSTNFKFTQQALTPEMGSSLIEKDNRRLNRRIQIAREVLRKFNLASLEAAWVPEEIGHFIDPYFSPNDSSVYLGSKTVFPTSIH